LGSYIILEESFIIRGKRKEKREKRKEERRKNKDEDEIIVNFLKVYDFKF
jgi:hypothetical protein